MEIAKARFTFMRHSVITANAVMRNLRLLYLGLICGALPHFIHAGQFIEKLI